MSDLGEAILKKNKVVTRRSHLVKGKLQEQIRGRVEERQRKRI